MSDERPPTGNPPNALREQREAATELRVAASDLFRAGVKWVALPTVLGLLSLWLLDGMYTTAVGGHPPILWMLSLGPVSIAFGVVAWLKIANLYDDLPELERASRALDASRKAQAKVVRLASEQRSKGGDLSIAVEVDGGDLSMVQGRGGVTSYDEVVFDAFEDEEDAESVMTEEREHEA